MCYCVHFPGFGIVYFCKVRWLSIHALSQQHPVNSYSEILEIKQQDQVIYRTEQQI